MRHTCPHDEPQAARSGARITLALVVAVALGLAALPATADSASAESATTTLVSPAGGRIGHIVGGCPSGSRPSHAGVDINWNSGTPVYASADGQVAAAVDSDATTGYGTQVVIAHADGVTTRYAHMVFGSLLVSAGGRVVQGQRIGTVGSTGASTGAHLHLEIRKNGVNVTNQYFRCGMSNVVALQRLSSASTGAEFDFDSDGRNDLLTVAPAGTIAIHKGDGLGGWRTTTLGGGWGTTTSLIHGDYDADSLSDFLAIRQDGSLWFYRNKGSDSFVRAQVGTGWRGMSLPIGGVDFTADGKADLIARSSGGALIRYPGRGDGRFGTATQIGRGWNGMTALIAGDFTGDRLGDVLARDTSGLLWLYPGATRGLSSRVRVGSGWNGMTAVTGGGDYCGDWRADVVARDRAGSLWCYPGNGAAGFLARVQLGTGWGSHRLIG